MVLILDLGKVLVSFRERREVLRDIARTFVARYPDNVDQLFPSGSSESVYALVDSGKLSLHGLWDRFCRYTLLGSGNLPFPLFAALYVEHIAPIGPVVEVVKRVRCPIALVSNGDFGSDYGVALLGIRHELHFPLANVFISHHFGETKPELLVCACKALEESEDVEPRDCVYVDDRECYVEAAHDLGMYGFVFDGTTESPDHFVEQLSALGIPISS